jgi:hypothetical protein
MPQKILCISATEPIMQTRKLLLERNGYEVLPALNFKEVEEACKARKFDLALVGHDIEAKIKRALGIKIREFCPVTPILEMCRYSPEIEGSTFAVTDSPAELLQAIADIFGGRPLARTAKSI